MLIGCIADDLTGATDLGVNLAREGLSVIQVNGVPGSDLDVPVADAVVVALKSRTIAPADAVAQSLAALAWLRARGAERIYFKYCSTFDSTPQGNIGPVTDALRSALGVASNGLPTPATPAYPRNGRTVYLGHLFVGDVLLSESGMRDHPLTPMTDANLVRVLSAQTAGKVGRLSQADLEAGADAARRRLEALAAEGFSHAIVDATRDLHLAVAGQACVDLPLTTGGAGLAVGIARALRERAHAGGGAWAVPSPRGPVAWLSGSCSEATREQVAAARQRGALVSPRSTRAGGETELRRRDRGRGRRRAGRGARARLRDRSTRRDRRRPAVSRTASTQPSSSRARSGRSPRRWRQTACARSSWRAARHRARWWRRWACARWPSGRKSTPACHGRAP